MIKGGRKHAHAVFIAVSIATWGSALVLMNTAQDRKISDEHLAIAVSAELNGYLTPCGCAKPMVGGLTRRANFFERLGTNVVKVENGDLTKAYGRQDEIKLETAIDVLNLMKYDAINLGVLDLKHGLENLRNVQKQFKGRLICANLVDENDRPFFARSTTIVKTIGTREIRVAIVGVLADSQVDAARIAFPEGNFEEAASAIDHVYQAALRADFRILMVQGPRVEAAALKKKYPAFQVIVTAQNEDDPIPPDEGDAVTFSTGTSGKHIGVAIFDVSSGKRVASRIRRLEADLGDHRGVQDLLTIYGRRVDAEGLLAFVPKLPSENGESFAGNAACVRCHSDAATTWHDSKHASALKTLEDVKHDRDPECVGCHVVGLDVEGGFRSRKETPELMHVGCESCHGPARRHASDPTPENAPRANGAQSCTTCHVPEHSPNFDYEKYWPMIKH